jgi:Ca2+-transporting ATPase
LADLECLNSPVETIHVIAGRARFRVAGLYHSPELKHGIERELISRHLIHRVFANPLTGSVLVEFDRQIEPGEILRLLEELVAEHLSLDVRSEGFDSNLLRNHKTNRNGGSHRPTKLAAGLSTQGVAAIGGNGWHQRGANAVAAQLASSKGGLSEQIAAERLTAYGPNRLPEIQARSSWTILLDQFDSMPTVLLFAAAGISILTGVVSDALAIGGVLGINAAIGFFTESESERAIRSLKHIVQPIATVVRNGKLRAVPSERLVPGDVIAVKPGSYICADCRLLESEQLTVDESALTGESLPVTKAPQTLDDPALALADRRNMLYMGTRVTGGSGLAMVVATGPRTELGVVHRLAGETDSPETPMERQLAQLGRQLVLVCTGICGLILGIGLFRGYGLLQMMETAISLAVASVPEGLPAVAATTLALGILKMRRHGVIIRKLEAVETLGCVQTVCLDKTGTLTLNRMEVKIVHSGTRQLEFRDGRFF